MPKIYHKVSCPADIEYCTISQFKKILPILKKALLFFSDNSELQENEVRGLQVFFTCTALHFHLPNSDLMSFLLYFISLVRPHHFFGSLCHEIIRTSRLRTRTCRDLSRIINQHQMSREVSYGFT